MLSIQNLSFHESWILFAISSKERQDYLLIVSRSITVPSALHGICNWSSFSSSSRWLVVLSWSSALYLAVRILPNKTGFCCCRRNLRQMENKDRKWHVRRYREWMGEIFNESSNGPAQDLFEIQQINVLGTSSFVALEAVTQTTATKILFINYSIFFVFF